VLEPTLLLLDEPLGALDLKLREHMKIELKQLQADFGTTFVYITHDQSEALVLSDHVAVMNRGRFEQLGTPQSLYYEPQTPFVAGFVGANNRIAGRASQVSGDLVEVTTEQGLRLFARKKGEVQAGGGGHRLCAARGSHAGAQGRRPARNQPRFQATVASLLFDGANSAVLVRETTTGTEFHIALPQTGQFADLAVGEDHRVRFRPGTRPVFPGAAAVSLKPLRP
jgi:spermidine/putrescine transport system ATP-binding protein